MFVIVHQIQAEYDFRQCVLTSGGHVTICWGRGRFEVATRRPPLPPPEGLIGVSRGVAQQVASSLTVVPARTLEAHRSFVGMIEIEVMSDLVGKGRRIVRDPRATDTDQRSLNGISSKG